MLSPNSSIQLPVPASSISEDAIAQAREGRAEEGAKAEETRIFTKLDAVLKEKKQLKLRSILRRIIVVAEINPAISNEQDVLAYYQRFFKKQQDPIQFTGIFLVLSTVCIHVLEGSPELVKTYFLDLHQDPCIKQSAPINSNLLSDPLLPTTDLSSSNKTPLVPLFRTQKLVYYEDDIDQRWFPSWLSRSLLDLKKPAWVAPGQDEVSATSNTHEWVKEMKGWARLVGEKLNNGSGKMEKVMDEVFGGSTQANASALLPKPDALGGILRSPFVFSVQEWVAWVFGDVPYTTALEEQFVWPAPRRILFRSSLRGELEKNI